MTPRLPKHFLALAATLLTLSIPSARALDLKEAKVAGLIGERPDGLVAVVGSADGEAAALAARINAARLTKYSDIASRNGTSPQAVQVIVGKELIAKAPPGSHILSENGEWRRK